MGFSDKLLTKTARDLSRLRNKASRPAKLAVMLFYSGTMGLLFVAPIIFGAYLGRWIDTLASGYSIRWTLSLIFLGIAVGSYNVYLFLQEKK